MLALGAFGYLLFATGRPGLFLAGLPLAFGAGWAWPGLFNLSVVRAAPEVPGRATGVTQTGNYVGGASGTLLFGWIAETWSYTAAWWLAAVLGALACGAVLVGRAMLRREAPAPAPS